MATLDPRMLDLVETLIAVNLDWLAFELVETIQIGRPHTEPHDTLATIRQELREGDQLGASGQPDMISQEPETIAGIDQIEWASKYVVERIETTLAYLKQSIETLDTISRGTVNTSDTLSDVPIEPVVVLSDGEGEKAATRADVETAISTMQRLRHSLERWSTQTRRDEQKR